MYLLKTLGRWTHGGLWPFESKFGISKFRTKKYIQKSFQENFKWYVELTFVGIQKCLPHGRWKILIFGEHAWPTIKLVEGQINSSSTQQTWVGK